MVAACSALSYKDTGAFGTEDNGWKYEPEVGCLSETDEWAEGIWPILGPEKTLII